MFAFSGKTARDRRIHTALPVTGFALVRAAEAWVFDAPDPDSARLTQFLCGEALTVHRARCDFLFVQSRRDHYCGWVETEALEARDEPPPPFSWMTRYLAPVTRDADIKSPLLDCLPPEAYFAVSRREGDYCRLAGSGWVHRAHIQAVEERRDPILGAREQIGKSYVWGGRGIAGMDCSALTQLCYRFAGRALPRDTDLQRHFMARHHRRVEDDEEQPGDLVFIPGHVMLVSAPGKIIHANGHHMRVVEEALAAAMQRYRKSFGATFFRESYRWQA